MIMDLTDIEYMDTYHKKPVFDNEQSSLTLISFKAGSERALHVDEKDEVAIIVEGIAEVSIGANTYTLHEKQMIVMLARVPHKLKAIENTKMLLLRPKHTH